ncbi:sorting nexin [Anaeramoeba flamelloides]|uniref:Sorting nexin n=1 Tax=Anaeramoeba flamelloides TaxID=1746091 RepID=A0ABQ8X2K2_9EUKA|nr:sorting nexin [Anaeramoeba flamelloides]
MSQVDQEFLAFINRSESEYSGSETDSENNNNQGTSEKVSSGIERRSNINPYQQNESSSSGNEFLNLHNRRNIYDENEIGTHFQKQRGSSKSSGSSSEGSENKNYDRSRSGSGSESVTSEEETKKTNQSDRSKELDTVLIGGENVNFTIKLQIVQNKSKKLTSLITYGVITTVDNSFGASTNYNSQKRKFTTFTTQRRRKDFVWLEKSLSQNFPGVIIPTFPAKKNDPKLSQEFTEIQRSELEKFLNQVARHSFLHFSKDYRKFLLQKITDLYKAKTEKSVSKNGLRKLHEMYNEYDTERGDTKYMDNSQKNWKSSLPILEELYKQTRVVRNMKLNLTNNLSNFNIKINNLSKLDNNKQILKIYSHFEKNMQNYKNCNLEEMRTEQIKFEIWVYKYIQICKSVQRGYNSVRKIVLGFQNAQKNEELKKKKLEKGQSTGSKKIEQIEEEYQNSQKLTKNYKIQMKKISSVFVSELKDLEFRKARDFHEMLLHFSKSQKKLSKSHIHIWENIVEQINGIQQQF